MNQIMAIALPFVVMIEGRIVLRIVGNGGNQIRHLEKAVYVEIHGLAFVQLLKHLLQPLFGIENSRLIHVVPEAVNSLIDQDPVLVPEPFPRLVIQHIREAAFSGPNADDEVISVFVLAEITVRLAFLIDVIAVFLLHAGINDRDQMDILLLHLLYKALKIRKGLPVDRKILVPLHVINIKVNAVQRNTS